MIINIRGTSGSGKSTIVRAIMRLYKTKIPYKVEGRKQPIGYVCRNDEGPALAVVGHYETACGGCDTISPLDRIYELVRESHKQGMNVLYEGLLISAEVNRAASLGDDLTVYHLDMPIEVCVASINERRWAKDKTKPEVNPRNTISKHKGTARAVERLAEAGITCHKGDRDEVLSMVRSQLGV